MLVHPDFSPVLLDLGGIKIHWYGVTYLLAFGSALLIGKYYAKRGRAPFTSEQVDDAIFYGALGTIAGGRIGYVLFYNFSDFLANPLWIFAVWDGGMSFHGGFLGVVIAAVIFSRVHQVRLGAICDFMALAVPPGLGFVRVGNFIGQELWGRETNVPWGMVFPNDPLGLVRHPSQLYEAFLEGLVLFLIVYFYAFFRQPRRPEWAAAALFVIGYGTFRFMVEFVREPDAHIGFDMFGWLSRGQLLSLPMILVGLIVMIWSYRRAATTQPAS